MKDDLRARVAAGTAIFRGERILLLHRSIQSSNPGLWDLPGGHAEVGESLRAAARRETQEETGFRVRLGPVFHVEVFSSLSKRGKVRPTVGVYYHCSAPPRVSPELDTGEHREYAWVSLQELEAYPALPSVEHAVRAAFRTRRVARRGKAGGRAASLPVRRDATLPVPV